ncbi:MAG: hypothetical protein AAFW73_16475 [Bacteroidota bacterium]
MKRIVYVVVFVLAGCLNSQLFAQSTTSLTAEATTATRLLDLSSTDWSFYIDEEQEIYYIDFEKINVNLNDLKVINADGEVVLEDQLYELPVNTIYELDLSELPEGTYEVALRTFTGVISKEITLD